MSFNMTQEAAELCGVDKNQAAQLGQAHSASDTFGGQNLSQNVRTHMRIQADAQNREKAMEKNRQAPQEFTVRNAAAERAYADGGMEF